MEETKDLEIPKKTEKRPALNPTKIITYSAVLSAVGLAVVMFMPTLNIGITTVTPGSHVALMLAMMIHPIVAAFTGVVTAVAFFLKHAQPEVIFRAFSHLVFAIPGAFLAQKLFKPQEKITDLKKLTVKALVLNGVTALIHAVAEMLAITLAFLILTLAMDVANVVVTAQRIFLIVGLITLAHSVVDFFIAYAVYIPLRRARLVSVN